MALEAYSQFHGFDWSNDPDWLTYKEKIEVTDESPEAMLGIRQKWFKRNINPDYDPSFKPAVSRNKASSTNETKSEETSKSEPEQPGAPPTRPKSSFTAGRMFLLAMNALAIGHGVLAFVNAFTYVLLGPAHMLFALVHSLLSYGFLLFQAVGRPQFNIQWVHTLVNNESMHYVMYCMLFLAQSPRPIALLPILIYSLINVSILLPRFMSRIGLPFRAVSSFSAYIKRHKGRLLLSAANIELAVFVSLLVDIFSGDLGTLLPAVLYLNFLGSRMQVSSWTQATVRQIEALVDSVLLSQSMPSFVAALYLQVKSIIVRLAKPRTRAAGPQQ